MSHPNPHHDPENEYPSDDFVPQSPKAKALSSKIKGFGSEHKPKSLKRLLKKSRAYRIKHF